MKTKKEDTLADKIKSQRSLVTKLSGKFSEESSKLRKLEEKDAEARSPFTIGDVIEYKKGWGKNERWVKAKLIRIKPMWGGHFNYIVRNIRKDGTEGATVGYARGVRKLSENNGV